MFISAAFCIFCLMTLLLILNRIDLGIKRDIRDLKQRISKLEHSYENELIKWNTVSEFEVKRFTKNDSTEN